MFYLTTPSTHFSFLHMAKDDTNGMRGNSRPTYHRQLFPKSCKVAVWLLLGFNVCLLFVGGFVFCF